MGVQGLWQLLNPTGRPVSLQSLEGKVLAVDVSIWLHQAVKGMRDKNGNPLPNAHLQVLFNRLCKLLFYRIKPVFVFDGGVPVLKRQTMEGRRQKKDFAEIESDKASKSLVQNLLKSHAINEVLKKDEKKVPTSSVPKPSTSKAEKPDLFELPPLPEEFESIAEESKRKEFTTQERMLLDEVDLDEIDTESEVFNSLPAEMKHEVLTMMKEKKKRHTWNQILELPQESVDFSQFQMAKLMKQSKLSSRIELVKKEMNDNRSNELTTFLGDDFYSDAIETRKIMSDDSTHSILIKGLGSKEQMEEMERIKLELEEKRKKEKMEEDAIEVDADVNASKDDKTKSVDFVEIEFHPKTTTNLEQSDKGECSSGNLLNTENGMIVEGVHSERQDVLKEIQDRMNALKDENPSDVVKMASESDSISRMDMEEDGFQQTNKNYVNEMNGSHDDAVVEVSERNNKIMETTLGNNDEIEIVSMDTNKTDSLSDTAVFQIPKDKITISQKSSTNSNTNNSSNQNTDLASKRLSILDELRQKVNVLSSDIPENKESEISNEDNENEDMDKTSEIQQNLIERRKMLLRKQLSHDESQVAKKQKIEDDEMQEERSQINIVESSSESESEDEGFIEVTFEPDKAHEDDLFPADIFQNVDSTENVEKSPIKIDEQKVSETNMHSNSPEIEEVTKLSPEMSEEEEEEEEEDTRTQRSPEKEGDHITDLVDQFKNFNENEMRDYQENLAVESRDLQQERGRQERLAVSITDQMYIEAQELLELFGVPYLISPMEAEAQCAQLDATDLTQGTITDDSDIWLFGGKRVYKNFFYQDKHVEFFSDVSIKSQLGLGRDVFIKLALLCGSDYTEGIPGVGVITGMELLTEFPGEDLEGLKAFKKWWDGTKTQITAPLEAKIRTKLRKLQVSEGFPNEVVVRAYMSPEVEDSQEKFTWGQPELDLIRIFTKNKFGWSKEKCDESLVPMMKQLNLKHTQTRINSFFQPESFLQPKNIKSKRLQKAIDIMQGKTDTESGTLINQSTSSPSQPSTYFQSASMQQITVGKGRVRGRGKGKGKGKSSAGQRSKVVITKEVNLSESSSESSGDELIANLDYESILGESEEVTVKQNKQATSSNTNIQENTKPMPIQAKKKSTNTKGKTNQTIGETSTQPKRVSRTNGSRDSISQTPTQTSSDSGTSRTETGTESQTNTAKGRRTKPKIRIGKVGHATEDFSWDLPKETVTKGFLEDEAAEFDKLKKVKSKSKNVKSVEVKEQKIDKGKKLAKNSQTTDKKTNKGKKPIKTNVINYSDESLGSSNVITSDCLLNRRTRSCKAGSVNRVIVMSDSDSD